MSNIHTFMDDDPATMPQAVHTEDLAEKIDSDLDMLRELCALPDAEAAVKLAEWLKSYHTSSDSIRLASDMFRLFLCQILFSRRPRHEAWLWAIATGMECAGGRDMSEVAAMFDESKQNISKQVNCRIDKFNLPRSRYVGSEASRKAHKRAKRDVEGIASTVAVVKTVIDT
jgi:hypothetical protein